MAPPRSRRRLNPSQPLTYRSLTLEPLEDRTVPSTSTVQTLLGTISYDPSQANRSTILVGFTDTVSDHTGWSALAGTTVATQLDLLPGYYIVQLSPDVSVEQALSAYAASGVVAEVAPDFLLTAEATPNDPQYRNQWALDNATGGDISAPAAWNVTRGSTRTVVSVMDTGIDYNHVDLYKNIWINQGEIPTTRKVNLRDIDGDGKITFYDLNDTRNQGVGKITDLNHDGRITADDLLAPMVKNKAGQDTGTGGWANGISEDGDRYVDDLVGWNFVNDTNRPMDDNNHGTHVAGIIGASGNNGTGVSGIAWVTQMMAVKFMNASGSGSIGSFIAGLDYAVKKGANISNNSWAGGNYTSYLYDAIVNARSKGHIFVAAAGNAGVNIDQNPTYPASYNVNNVVVVASTNRSDSLSSFSNYGARTVDVAAPGEGILSTLPKNQYGVMSGTSMATPQVTGTLALIWAQNPTWKYDQVINRLLATVDKRSGLTGKVASGGRINAAAAVGSVTTTQTQTPTPNQAPRVQAASATGSANNTLNKITITFSEAVNPTTMTTSAIRLTGPIGNAITLSSIRAVAGSNNSKWELSFQTQIAPGTYTLRISNTVKDLQGAALATYSTTFSITKATTTSNTQSQPLRDHSFTASAIAVNQNVQVQDITVQVNIQHSNDRDLVLYLQAPSGKRVILANGVGGSGDGFIGTNFSDAASQSITQASAPFTGTFRPEQALSAFQNDSAQGNWLLLIQDLTSGNTGTLLNWSLTINATNAQPLSAQGGAIQSISEGTVPDLSTNFGAMPASPLSDLPEPATLTTTVSGPGLIGMQLVSPVTQPGPILRSSGSSQRWLGRDLQDVGVVHRIEPSPDHAPVAEEESLNDRVVSDLVFQKADPRIDWESELPTESTAPDATPEGLEKIWTELS